MIKGFGNIEYEWYRSPRTVLELANTNQKAWRLGDGTTGGDNVCTVGIMSTQPRSMYAIMFGAPEAVHERGCDGME